MEAEPRHALARQVIEAIEEDKKKKLEERVAEKRLNGCADLYDAEEKKECEVNKALTEIHKAIQQVEIFLNAG